MSARAVYRVTVTAYRVASHHDDSDLASSVAEITVQSSVVCVVVCCCLCAYLFWRLLRCRALLCDLSPYRLHQDRADSFGLYLSSVGCLSVVSSSVFRTIFILFFSMKD